MKKDVEDFVQQILGNVDALVTDSHIVYASGRHGAEYVNKDALYPFTADLQTVCDLMAEPFLKDKVEVVIGPAVEAAILASRVAGRLKTKAVYAEKTADGSSFKIRKTFRKFIAGKRVLVVEDVLTTGNSISKVIEEVRLLAGTVIGVSAIFNRGAVSAEAIGNVPKLSALINLKLNSWDEADCPLCKHAVPINTDVGNGEDFLARQKR